MISNTTEGISSILNAIQDAESRKKSVTSDEIENPNIEVQDQPNEIDSEGFLDFMKEALTAHGKDQVSEEEIFASLLEQRLGDSSPEAAAYFATAREKQVNLLRRADGYVNMEEASIRALRNTVEEGHIEAAEAEKIFGEAFMGAQLDDNLEELWDDRGSASDPTIAVAAVEEALLKLEMFIESLKNGEEFESRSLNLGSTGAASASGHSSSSIQSVSSAGIKSEGSQPLNANTGFLWKPTSESDNKLVVLLPQALRGLVNRVEIHSSLPPSDGTRIAEGRFAGDTMNGNRAHFRFDKPGSSYGQNVHVVAHKNDGSILHWDISDGGRRHE